MAIVLGDNFPVKTQESSEDSFLSMALNERSDQNELIADKSKKNFQSSKSSIIKIDEKSSDFRKRYFEKNNTFSPPEKILRNENDAAESSFKQSFGIILNI